MTSYIVLIVAGIPEKFAREFTSKFMSKLHEFTSELLERTKSVVLHLPLELSDRYTDNYSEELYDRLAKKLKSFDDWHDRRVSVNTRLLVLYLCKDMNDSCLFKRFGMEALIVPLKIRDMSLEDLKNKVESNSNPHKLVKKLVEKGYEAFVYATKLLDVISDEITRQDSRTCLLLPCKSFGKDIDDVFKYVRDSASSQVHSNKFKADLRRFRKQLPKDRVGDREYFKGKNGVVFKGPSKSRERHGLAPVWREDSAHNASCVIRGRLRFGAPYAPDFHYDCIIPKKNLTFYDCHDSEIRINNKKHLNITPNDNIR